MANFNEKVMSLFRKNRAQLLKEAQRRGLTFGSSTERTIAEIIWKDAYDAGVIKGRNQSTPTFKDAKPEVREYCLHCFDSGVNYRFELTEEQVRVIEWMINNEFLTDVELSDWCYTFEDVGRI